MVASRRAILAVAVLLRCALIVYGLWHDVTFPVKYTDIDYDVFTDAARHVATGGSPYARDTFRYTPLLAYLLLPNVLWFKAFGKFLFAAIDLAVAALMLCRLRVKAASTPRAFSFSAPSHTSQPHIPTRSAQTAAFSAAPRTAHPPSATPTPTPISATASISATVTSATSQAVASTSAPISATASTSATVTSTHPPSATPTPTPISATASTSATVTSAALQAAARADASGARDRIEVAALCAWLCNPYTATISTRGNGDSIVPLMQVALLLLMQRRPAPCAVDPAMDFAVAAEVDSAAGDLPVAADDNAHSPSEPQNSGPAAHNPQAPATSTADLEGTRRLFDWGGRANPARRTGLRQRAPAAASAEQGVAYSDGEALQMEGTSEGRCGMDGMMDGMLSCYSWTGSDTGDHLVAGALFGLFVHWRVFPVIYGPSLVCCIWHKTAQNKRRIRTWAVQCCAFGAAALLVFLGLGHLFYTLYGDPFLHEAFLHHLGRHDPRHNFSPHFYFTYLYYFNPAAAQTLAGTSALPLHVGALLTPAAASDVYASDVYASDSYTSNQSELLAPSMPAWQNPAACAMPISAVVICCLALRLSRHLDLCWLLTTLAFVAFNKVSTAQYFVWYFGLLPLVWPNMRWDRWRVLAGTGAFWLLTQVNWLLWAYLLEFQGLPVFSVVWLSSLLFMAAHVAVMAAILTSFKRAPFAPHHHAD